MHSDDSLSPHALLDLFAEEIQAHGGRVTDRFDSPEQAFSRSTLPLEQEVAPNDRLHGGVAVRVTLTDIWVHPYTMRQVCTNGAIAAKAIQSRHIGELGLYGADRTIAEFRAAIQLCCAPETFDTSIDRMRAAQADRGADFLITIMPMLSRMRGGQQFLQQIMHNMTRSGDRSRYGLMNAITAVARDEKNPETKWELEALGGGVPTLKRLTPNLTHAAIPQEETVEV